MRYQTLSESNKSCNTFKNKQVILIHDVIKAANFHGTKDSVFFNYVADSLLKTKFPKLLPGIFTNLLYILTINNAMNHKLIEKLIIALEKENFEPRMMRSYKQYKTANFHSQIARTFITSQRYSNMTRLIVSSRLLTTTTVYNDPVEPNHPRSELVMKLKGMISCIYKNSRNKKDLLGFDHQITTEAEMESYFRTLHIVTLHQYY